MKNKLCKIFTGAIAAMLATTILAGSSAFALESATSKAQESYKTDPKVSGTFVQSWLAGSWSEATWDKEMQIYKEAGIDTLILADVATRTKKSAGAKWNIYYPSEIPEIRDNLGFENSIDVIDLCLYKAEQYGIKVYLGMGGDDQWWVSAANGADFLNYADISAQIAEEIYTNYKSRYPDTFYGFYFVPEIHNSTSIINYVDNLAAGMNTIIDTLNQLDANMPMMLSPYFVDAFWYPNIDKTKAFYTDFFTKVNFRPQDIFMPQDSVGAGNIKLEKLEDVIGMYLGAMETAAETNPDKKVHFYMNCENFTPSFASSDLKRFTQQLKISAKYCEEIFTFSYDHYYSPINIDESYHQAYMSYVNSGFADDITPPNAPENIRVKYTDAIETLTLSWDTPADNSSVISYEVYKDGELLTTLTPSRADGGALEALGKSWMITGFTPPAEGENIKFEVYAIDAFLNKSQSATLIVNKDNYMGDGSSSNLPYPTVDRVPFMDFNSSKFSVGEDVTFNQFINGGDAAGDLYKLSIMQETANNKALKIIFNPDSIENGIYTGIKLFPSSALGTSSQFLPQGMKIPSSSMENGIVFYVDSTEYTQHRMLGLNLVFTEKDYKADGSDAGSNTIRNVAKDVYAQDENGDFMVKLKVNNNNIEIPQGYKGFIAIPFGCMRPTWSTMDADKSVNLQKIVDMQIYFGGYNDSESFILDEFGFYGPMFGTKAFKIDIPVEPTYTLGDINDDKVITIKDALLALQHSVRLTTLKDNQFLAADVDKDKNVTIKDALQILQYSVKLIDSFKPAK